MLVYDDKIADKFSYTNDVESDDDIFNHLVQIEEDRYNGVYSGHPYTAWCGVRPEDISGGDPCCRQFWETWKDKAVYGAGSTPQQAFLDLIKKLEDLHFFIIDIDDPEVSFLKVVMLTSCVERPKAMLCDSDDFRKWVRQ